MFCMFSVQRGSREGGGVEFTIPEHDNKFESDFISISVICNGMTWKHIKITHELQLFTLSPAPPSFLQIPTLNPFNIQWQGKINNVYSGVCRQCWCLADTHFSMVMDVWRETETYIERTEKWCDCYNVCNEISAIAPNESHRQIQNVMTNK